MPSAAGVEAGAGPLLSDFAQVAERLAAVTVAVRTGARAGGSGIVWRADGLIVTSAHVVARDAGVKAVAEVALADGRRFPASLVALDHARDLALLRVRAPDLPAAIMGDSSRLRPGELVLAIGHPFGLHGALAAGVVHARPGHGGAGRLIQADLRLAPGNSGGPLADALGRVVGVNAMIAGGLALAVPSLAVQAFVDRACARA